MTGAMTHSMLQRLFVALQDPRLRPEHWVTIDPASVSFVRREQTIVSDDPHWDGNRTTHPFGPREFVGCGVEVVPIESACALGRIERFTDIRFESLGCDNG